MSLYIVTETFFFCGGGGGRGEAEHLPCASNCVKILLPHDFQNPVKEILAPS